MEKSLWARLIGFIRGTLTERLFESGSAAIVAIYIFRDRIFADIPVYVIPHLFGAWIIIKGIFTGMLGGFSASFGTYLFNKKVKSYLDDRQKTSRRGKGKRAA